MWILNSNGSVSGLIKSYLVWSINSDGTVAVRIVLKRILKKFCGREWTGLIWLTMTTSGRLFWKQKWISEFHKIRWISWLAEEEGLCSMDLHVLWMANHVKWERKCHSPLNLRVMLTPPPPSPFLSVSEVRTVFLIYEINLDVLWGHRLF